MTEPRGGSQRGFTLLETIIVFTVLMSVVSIMANLITTTSSTQKYIERMARCTEVNQGSTSRITGSRSLVQGWTWDTHLEARAEIGGRS